MYRCRFLLWVLVATSWAGSAFADAGGADELARQVSRNYERYRAIESLRIKFFLEYQHLNGQRKFAFNRVDVTTYRKGDKLRLGFVGVRPNGSSLIREMAWDGKTGTSNEPSGDGGSYSIRSTAPDLLYYYNYYVEFLSYPDATGSLPALAKKGGDRGPGAPWLPKVIVARNDGCRIEERTDDEGVTCQVWDRAGYYAFWFDPAKGHALRRRDTWDPATGNLITTTTLRDFRAVGDVWLPGTIVREEYGGPDDPISTPNRVKARKVIHIVEVSTAEIGDATFILPAPAGVVVHDARRRTFFTHYRSGDNPVIAAAETARSEVSRSNTTPALVLCAVLLGLLTLATAAALCARRFRSGGGRQ